MKKFTLTIAMLLMICLILSSTIAHAASDTGAVNVANTITFATLIRASYQEDTYSGGKEAFYDLGLLPANEAPDENGQLIYYTYPKDYKVCFDVTDDAQGVTAVTVKRLMAGADSYETYVKAYNLLAGLATPFITSEDMAEDFVNAFGNRWISATSGEDTASFAGAVRFQSCDITFFRDDLEEKGDEAEVGFILTYPEALTEDNLYADPVFAQLSKSMPKES